MRRQGVTRVELETESTNSAALLLYRGLGFLHMCFYGCSYFNLGSSYTMVMKRAGDA